MRLQEVCEATGLTRKAIEWYQKQGLVHAHKSPNGYRDFTPEDVQALREISLWRQLGLSTAEMRKLQKTEDKAAALRGMAAAHEQTLARQQKNIEDLRRLASYYDAPTGVPPSPDMKTQTMLQKLRCAFPGSYGRLMVQHFTPYLQQAPQTPAQQEALQTIIDYLDGLQFQPPLLVRWADWLAQRKGAATEDAAAKASLLSAQRLEAVMEADEAEQERFARFLAQQAKQRQKWYIKYSPFVQAGRRMRQKLQAAGYYNVMLPNLCKASPAYAAYAEKLEAFNHRMMEKTGIVYDEKGYYKFAG